MNGSEQLAFGYGRGVGQTVRTRAAAEAVPRRYTDAVTWRGWRTVDRGYLGLLAFTAVLLVRPQDQLPALSAIHFAEIAAILGIAPMILDRLSRGLPPARLTLDTMAMFAFGLVMLATAPFSIWPGGAVGVFTDFYAKVLIVFLLMLNTLSTPKRLEQISWIILVCCGYVAARAVFDYARGVNLVEGGRVAGAVGGMFGNPNDLAMNLIAFIPLGIIVALSPRHSATRRLTAGLLVMLMLAATVFTKSRSGFLGLTAAMLTLMVLGRHVRPGFGRLVALAGICALPFMPSSFWERMGTILDEERDRTAYTGSRESRRVVMAEGMQTFLDYPLTGVGAGQFKNYNPSTRRERWRETHNAILQVAAETGIAGLGVFLFLIARGVRAGGRTRRMLKGIRPGPDQRDLALDRAQLYEHSIAASAGLAGWFVCALFASVAYNWTFYFLFALAIVARDLTTVRARDLRTRS
jgi:putative inorganic carbon (HCO3(-)) transporter